MRNEDQKSVSPYLCPQESRPEILIKTCNDHPCPPRWNHSEFSQCSKPCGIGIQTRDVNCIHEVTRGGGNTIIVPNNMCPQPPPPDRQYCNVLDCPVKWHTTDWTKVKETEMFFVFVGKAQGLRYSIMERGVSQLSSPGKEYRFNRPIQITCKITRILDISYFESPFNKKRDKLPH